jgi:DNA repair protein RadC
MIRTRQGKRKTDSILSLFYPSINDMKKLISSPREAVGVANKLVKDNFKEHTIGLYLDTRNRLIKSEVISIGTLNSCLVHPREVFYPAIKQRCASMIFLHNHPSGIVDPSEDDVETTKRLRNAGKILGIEVTDSIIFEKGGTWHSHREAGSGWN